MPTNKICANRGKGYHDIKLLNNVARYMWDVYIGIIRSRSILVRTVSEDLRNCAHLKQKSWPASNVNEWAYNGLAKTGIDRENSICAPTTCKQRSHMKRNASRTQVKSIHYIRVWQIAVLPSFGHRPPMFLFGTKKWPSWRSASPLHKN